MGHEVNRTNKLIHYNEAQYDHYKNSMVEVRDFNNKFQGTLLQNIHNFCHLTAVQSSECYMYNIFKVFFLPLFENNIKNGQKIIQKCPIEKRSKIDC